MTTVSKTSVYNVVKISVRPERYPTSETASEFEVLQLVVLADDGIKAEFTLFVKRGIPVESLMAMLREPHE